MPGTKSHRQHRVRHMAILLGASCLILAGCAGPNGKTRSQGAAGNSAPRSSSVSPGGPLSSETLSPVLSADQKKEQEKTLHRKLISQMMEQGSWYAALAHCDSYDQQWGADMNSRLLRADAQRMTGQLPAAEKLYQGLRETALRGQAFHGLSQISAQRGQWTQASALLADAIRLQPLNARLYNDQGLIMMMLNKPQEAFTALRKSQELDPDKPLARANIALYAAVYDEDALFVSMSNQLNWKSNDIATVRLQAQRIRNAHLQGRPPEPDIFSGR